MKKPCSPRHLLRSIPEGGPLLITARTLALVALLLALCSAVPSPADAAAPFNDVPEGHPYAVAIADLSTRGIISGFDDGTFRPGSSVTRQQFAKMIVRTLDYPIPAGIECPFTDVDPNPNPKDPLYPAKYVAVCALHGVTQGKTATTFEPGSIRRIVVPDRHDARGRVDRGMARPSGR